MHRATLISSAAVPLRMVFFMWVFFFLEHYYGWTLSLLGIVPRTLPGLAGVLFAPLIHGDVYHLMSNTVPLLFLGTMLFFIYERIAAQVFFRSYVWTNMLVWLFARPATHIGASGVVYGLAFFLIFFGFFRRDFVSITISVFTVLLYGSVFYGILPGNPFVSWESHFGGALVGIFSAFNFSRLRRVY
ncbi:MAG: rhomboid family intramembrane serine protease [Cyclobacteriaceae bacterium]|nr:MAG: rhomboid family intramembrane serine protease [Cyclobacteriaceae bacterium]